MHPSRTYYKTTPSYSRISTGRFRNSDTELCEISAISSDTLNIGTYQLELSTAGSMKVIYFFKFLFLIFFINGTQCLFYEYFSTVLKMNAKENRWWRRSSLEISITVCLERMFFSYGLDRGLYYEELPYSPTLFSLEFSQNVGKYQVLETSTNQPI